MRPVYDVNSYLGICPIFQEFVLVRMQDPCQNLVKVYTGSRRLFFDTRLPRQAPASYAYYQVQDDLEDEKYIENHYLRVLFYIFGTQNL